MPALLSALSWNAKTASKFAVAGIFALLITGLGAIAQDTGDSSIAPTSGGGMEESPAADESTVAPTEPSAGVLPGTSGGYPATNIPTAAPGAGATSAPSGPAATSGAPEQQQQAEAQPSVTVGTGIASAPIVLTPGAGRFGERPLKLRAFISQGYDDNVLTTPDEQPPLPTPTPTPITEKTIANPNFGKPVPIPQGPQSSPAPTPEPRFITLHFPTPTPTPKIVPQERVGSWVTRATAGLNWATASPRSLLSLDLGGGVNYYWDRPTDTKSDYVGNLQLAYSHKITPKLRLNAALNSIYQTNPDFSLRNAPIHGGGGAYLNSSGRLELNAVMTPRLTTVTSYTLNSNYYTESQSQGNNVMEHIYGEELRYLLSPRQTLAVEYRYGLALHKTKTDDSTAHYILTGLDTKWTNRFTSTIRVGEEIRTYDNQPVTTGSNTANSSQTQSSPRFEAVLSYVYARGSTIGLTAEYGLNAGTGGGSRDETTLRTGLGISHVFTPRSVAIIGINWVRNNTKASGAQTEDIVEDALGLNLGYRYVLTPRTLLSLDYNLSKDISTVPFTDYYRQIYSVGLQHSF